MEDVEAEEYVAKIAQLLRNEGFGWIVDEVQAAIALGKLVRKEIVEEPLPGEDDVVRRRRRANRSSTEPLNVILDSAGVSQVEDAHLVANLTDPLHAPLALLQPGRISRQVNIDLRAKPLKVEAFSVQRSPSA